MASVPCGSPVVDCRFYETKAYRRGFQWVAGIDEAGRGPLAGPVVAAAVVLPAGVELLGVRDSKQLSAKKRALLYDEIHSRAISVGIGCVDALEIDRINILQAAFRAMLEAVQSLRTPPDFLLIDGPYTLPISIPQEGVVRGDQLSLSISAASIVAKVYRDRLMETCHLQYPVYAFNKNKGYGSAAHREALRVYGPCAIHRKTFRGVLASDAENTGSHGLGA